MTDQELLAEYRRCLEAFAQDSVTEEEQRNYDIAMLHMNAAIKNYGKNAEAVRHAEVVIKEMDEKRARRTKAFHEAFAKINGRLTVEAALAECRLLLEAAKALMDGKVVEVPAPVVKFQYFKSEHVQGADVDAAQKLAAEAAELIGKQAALIETNKKRIEEAQQRTSEDPALVEQLQHIEEQRAQALLSGKDVSSFTEEILKLKGQVDAHRLAVKLAQKDVSFLQQNEVAMHARLEKIREVASIIGYKAKALKAHGMVKPCNELSARLAGYFKELKQCYEEQRALEIGGLFPINYVPSCVWPMDITLPIWHGCTEAPNEAGEIVPVDMDLYIHSEDF